jgi:hypothetical protein
MKLYSGGFGNPKLKLHYIKGVSWGGVGFKQISRPSTTQHILPLRMANLKN